MSSWSLGFTTSVCWSGLECEGEVISVRPTSTQRQILQRLRTDTWRSFTKLNIVVGSQLLDKLVANGWIERRQGQKLELKLTETGLEALRAKIPTAKKPNTA
jgi:DNA-binding PadR family transcriptional regulator